ncbi:MAG: ATP-binding cassette domain-containing protein [Verrucomicrobia bacterium]|nr:ATP-binding cassette domain-containing protein [Verrucomicrobiota bacterium]
MPEDQSASVFDLSHVCLAPKRLLDVTLSIRPGVTAVLGASGSGKTSLLNILAAFEKPSAGVVKSGARIFWAPQDGGLWPGMTVHEHLSAMTREKDAIARTLDAFELAAQATQVPATLSRGQQSRLTVARALLADCSALIMDEPLAHIDTNRRPPFWEAIRKSITARGQSLIFATHEPELVLGEAEHVICMSSGEVFTSGTVAELYWQAASPEHAAFLGPVNWVTREVQTAWFPQTNAAIPQCLRPEQLCVDAATSSPSPSPITVYAARFRGSHEELILHHAGLDETKTFWHRPSNPVLRPGIPVTLGER